MRRSGESPVRVLETNIDLSLTVNGDVNKGPNGNNRSSLHNDDHHQHPHPHHPLRHHDHHHDAEAAAATDTMLSHRKCPLPADADDTDGDARPRPRPGKLQRIADQHGLTKKGLTLLLAALCFCFFLLVVLLGMAAKWPRSHLQANRKICLTSDCLRASAQVSPSPARLMRALVIRGTWCRGRRPRTCRRRDRCGSPISLYILLYSHKTLTVRVVSR